jgi:putative hydrolase of the HAD superfamily
MQEFRACLCDWRLGFASDFGFGASRLQMMVPPFHFGNQPMRPSPANPQSPIRNPQSPKAILFDAVGTLICAEPPVADVYFAAGRRFGSSLAAGEVGRRFRAAMRRRQGSADSLDRPPTDHPREREMWRGIVADVFADVAGADGELFEELWRHFARPESWRLYDDAADTWRELQQQGLLVGVASNFDDRLLGICRGLPPLDACRHLFWSARIGHPKPSPHFFGRVQAELSLAPHEIVLVGDDWISDVLGARGAGWSAVFLDRSGQAKSAEALATLHDLPKWLAS